MDDNQMQSAQKKMRSAVFKTSNWSSPNPRSSSESRQGYREQFDHIPFKPEAYVSPRNFVLAIPGRGPTVVYLKGLPENHVVYSLPDWNHTELLDLKGKAVSGYVEVFPGESPPFPVVLWFDHATDDVHGRFTINDIISYRLSPSFTKQYLHFMDANDLDDLSVSIPQPKIMRLMYKQTKPSMEVMDTDAGSQDSEKDEGGCSDEPKAVKATGITLDASVKAPSAVRVGVYMHAKTTQMDVEARRKLKELKTKRQTPQKVEIFSYGFKRHFYDIYFQIRGGKEFRPNLMAELQKRLRSEGVDVEELCAKVVETTADKYPDFKLPVHIRIDKRDPNIVIVVRIAIMSMGWLPEGVGVPEEGLKGLPENHVDLL